MATNTVRDNAPTIRQTLTASEAARYLGLNTNTLANWRNAGKSPRYYKLGTRVVYRKEDLDSYMETCAQNPWAVTT